MPFFLRRGWWKPWNWSTRTWLLAIVISAGLSPFVVRWACLWQVPDVALPYVVDDVIGEDVPKYDDAFTSYESIIQTLGNNSTTWLDDAVDQATRSFDVEWDARLDQWLVEHADILAQFERASQMERAQWISPRDVHINLLIRTHNNLRKLTKIAIAEGYRCQRAGDLEQAWKWHRAVLRCASHAEKPGFSMAVCLGRAIRNQAYAAVGQWAAHASLTAEQLRSARTELTEVTAHRMTLSDVLKVEDLMIKNTLDQEDGPNFLYAHWQTNSLYEPLLLRAKRFYLWMIAQPEVSLRLCRQVLVNQVDQIDKPLSRRRNVLRSEYPTVFELDPERPRARGQLDAAQLVRTLQGSWGQHLIEIELFTSLGAQKSSPVELDHIHRVGNAHMSMIDVVLAAQQFQRIHQEFPASIEQLVPEFLDALPFDPMSDSGAPLNYRRDENGEAVIWSIGVNQIDDSGDIDGKEPKDAGYRIQLIQRQDSEDSLNRGP